MSLRPGFSLLALCLFFPEQLFAAGSVLQDETTSYFRFLWGLLVVLGIIYILYGLLRKRFSIFTPGKNDRIKILEMKPLGGRRAICLVQVQDKEYLLGVCDHSISHLASLDTKRGNEFSTSLAKAQAEVKP